MPRTIYVLVYPSRLFAAHWSFWVPYIGTENQQSNIGDRIHVTGDRLNGFQYEYIRNYDVCEDNRNPNAFPIGLVSETHLSLANKNGTVTSSEEEDQSDAENIVFNAFDAACREVPAPGPSLNKVNREADSAAGTSPKMIEVKDCQWWMKEAALHLVQIGILLPLDGKNEVENPILRKNRYNLPSPKEIREKDIKINSFRARSPRPPPIPFEELGLIVKYGSEITIAEAQCLWYFNKHMKDAVPTPELYGWCHDNGETFIYMEFVNADTLEDVWPSLNQDDQNIICEQLRTSVEAWRNLRQETEPYYIGHIGRQGVGDIIFSDAGDPQAGPFDDITQFHDFFARYSCRQHPDWNPRRDFPELAGLTDDRPVVFTHSDLDRSNILIFPRDGESPPRVAAIIDWHQSGWYPSDWEWLKALSRCEAFWEGGRDTAWLLRIMTPADKNYQAAWEFITGSLGF